MGNEELMPIIFPAPIDEETNDILLGDTATYFANQRELTSAYIAENPTQVILTPNTKTRTSSGGYVWTPGVPRASQTVRLIEYTSVVGQGGARSSEGEVHEHRWTMMMEWDAIAALYDTFVYDGVTWSVVDFLPKDNYQVRALVDRYAR
jgi:hypothetical protein